MYYLYSCVSGSLEIGIVYGGILQGYPLWKVLLLGLAYQIGNMVPIPCTLSKKERCLGIAVLIALWGVRYSSSNAVISYWCLVGIIIILSGLIQSVRTGFSFAGEKWKKRLFRVLGFGTALFYGIDPEICVMSTSILMVLTEFFIRKYIESEKYCALNGMHINRTMLFHQIHYFVYAYSMIGLACGLVQYNEFSVIYFVASWLTYLMTEPILKRFGHRKCLWYLTVGHVMLAALLIFTSYAAVKGSILFFLLWILSGFGGGTVFCIKPVEQERGGNISAESWTLSENLGHVLGSLTACIWVGFGMEAALLPAVGAGFAILTVFSTAAKGEKFKSKLSNY